MNHFYLFPFKVISKYIFIILLALCLAEDAGAQNDILKPAPAVNQTRVIIIGAAWGTLYSVSLVGLSQLWYKKYPHSKFHFFNDMGEWNQMDKLGHVFTAYFESNFTSMALHWAGVNNKTAAWIGFATGEGFQLTLETMDGFSSEWGFSLGDFSANMIGGGIFLGQQLGWQEQRVQLKFSYWPVSYSPDLQARSTDLYGQSFFSRLLKDYNSQTYWYSVNVYSFIKKDAPNFPQWFNVSVGCGAGGLLGARRNEWKVSDTTMVNHTDIPRFRRFYLSVDADLTRIDIQNEVPHTLFTTFNVLKVPAPTLEFNTKKKVVFHPLFY